LRMNRLSVVPFIFTQNSSEICAEGGGYRIGWTDFGPE